MYLSNSVLAIPGKFITNSSKVEHCRNTIENNFCSTKPAKLLDLLAATLFATKVVVDRSIQTCSLILVILLIIRVYFLS